jgi:hypothetical protein
MIVTDSSFLYQAQHMNMRQRRLSERSYRMGVSGYTSIYAKISCY